MQTLLIMDKGLSRCEEDGIEAATAYHAKAKASLAKARRESNVIREMTKEVLTEGVRPEGVLRQRSWVERHYLATDDAARLKMRQGYTPRHDRFDAVYPRLLRLKWRCDEAGVSYRSVSISAGFSEMLLGTALSRGGFVSDEALGRLEATAERLIAERQSAPAQAVSA